MTQATEYKNGDIVETKPYAYPLISHFAILIFWDGYWQVIHTTTDAGVSMQRFSEFEKTGKIVAIRSSRISGISSDELMSNYRKYAGKKYDLEDFNCETLVNLFVENRKISYQYILFQSIVFTAILLFLIKILK